MQQPTLADIIFRCIILQADPGFLERGFVCIKVWGGGGVCFADFISVFLNIP